VEKSQVYEDAVEYPDTSDAENESIVWTSDDGEEESSGEEWSDDDTFSVHSDDEVETKTCTLDTRLTARRILTRPANEKIVPPQQRTNPGSKTNI